MESNGLTLVYIYILKIFTVYCQFEANSAIINSNIQDRYTAEENRKLFEGDVVLDKRLLSIVRGIRNPRKWLNGREISFLWPTSKIPYFINKDISSFYEKRCGGDLRTTLEYIIDDSSSLGAQVRDDINSAMDDIAKSSCIQFYRKEREKDFLSFYNGTGCWSYIGHRGGEQMISLGKGCDQKGTITHQLLHALGFFHEHTRQDRDKTVSVEWKNVEKGMQHNFLKYNHGPLDDLNDDYDVSSLMNLPIGAFSKEGQPTLLFHRSTVFKPGQRMGMSAHDIIRLNTLYRCAGQNQEISSLSSGSLNQNVSVNYGRSLIHRQTAQEFHGNEEALEEKEFRDFGEEMDKKVNEQAVQGKEQQINASFMFQGQETSRTEKANVVTAEKNVKQGDNPILGKKRAFSVTTEKPVVSTDKITKQQKAPSTKATMTPNKEAEKNPVGIATVPTPPITLTGSVSTNPTVNVQSTTPNPVITTSFRTQSWEGASQGSTPLRTSPTTKVGEITGVTTGPGIPTVGPNAPTATPLTLPPIFKQKSKEKKEDNKIKSSKNKAVSPTESATATTNVPPTNPAPPTPEEESKKVKHKKAKHKQTKSKKLTEKQKSSKKITNEKKKKPTPDSDTADVTKPTEASSSSATSKPTAMTKPTEVTNPSETTKVSGASNPTKATELTSVGESKKQTKPASVPPEQTKPTSPSKPSIAIETVKPTKPAAETNKVSQAPEDTKPTTTPEPSTKTLPTKQTKIAEETRPSSGSAPVETSKPTTATKQGQRPEPNKEVKPSDQNRPSESVKPTQVTNPSGHKSTKPTKPITPSIVSPTKQSNSLGAKPTQAANPSEEKPKEATSPSEGKPKEANNPSDEKPTEATNPSEGKPTEATKPSEAKPTEATSPSEGKATEANNPSDEKPTEATNPSEGKPTEATKPSEAKPTEATSPSEGKATEAANPSEGKPTEATKPSGAKPTEASNPSDDKPTETTNPSDAKPTEATNPSDAKPTEATNPSDAKTTEATNPSDNKPTEATNPSDTKPTETTNPSDAKPTEATNPSDAKPTEATNPSDAKPTEATNPSDAKPTEATNPSEGKPTSATTPSEVSPTPSVAQSSKTTEPSKGKTSNSVNPSEAQKPDEAKPEMGKELPQPTVPPPKSKKVKKKKKKIKTKPTPAYATATTSKTTEEKPKIKHKRKKHKKKNKLLKDKKLSKLNKATKPTQAQVNTPTTGHALTTKKMAGTHDVKTTPKLLASGSKATPSRSKPQPLKAKQDKDKEQKPFKSKNVKAKLKTAPAVTPTTGPSIVTKQPPKRPKVPGSVTDTNAKPTTQGPTGQITTVKPITRKPSVAPKISDKPKPLAGTISLPKNKEKTKGTPNPKIHGSQPTKPPKLTPPAPVPQAESVPQKKPQDGKQPKPPIATEPVPTNRGPTRAPVNLKLRNKPQGQTKQQESTNKQPATPGKVKTTQAAKTRPKTAKTTAAPVIVTRAKAIKPTKPPLNTKPLKLLLTKPQPIGSNSAQISGAQKKLVTPGPVQTAGQKVAASSKGEDKAIGGKGKPVAKPTKAAEPKGTDGPVVKTTSKIAEKGEIANKESRPSSLKLKKMATVKPTPKVRPTFSSKAMKVDKIVKPSKATTAGKHKALVMRKINSRPILLPKAKTTPGPTKKGVKNKTMAKPTRAPTKAKRTTPVSKMLKEKTKPKEKSTSGVVKTTKPILTRLVQSKEPTTVPRLQSLFLNPNPDSTKCSVAETIMAQVLPTWPDDFRLSYLGNPDDFACKDITKPGRTDKLCWRCGKKNPGFIWSTRGKVPGMKCLKIDEPEDKSMNHNSYLCMPIASPYRFIYLFKGPIFSPTLRCIRWYDKMQPYTWYDNYLCATVTNRKK